MGNFESFVQNDGSSIVLNTSDGLPRGPQEARIAVSGQTYSELLRNALNEIINIPSRLNLTGVDLAPSSLEALNQSLQALSVPVGSDRAGFTRFNVNPITTEKGADRRQTISSDPASTYMDLTPAGLQSLELNLNQLLAREGLAALTAADSTAIQSVAGLSPSQGRAQILSVLSDVSNRNNLPGDRSFNAMLRGLDVQNVSSSAASRTFQQSPGSLANLESDINQFLIANGIEGGLAPSEIAAISEASSKAPQEAEASLKALFADLSVRLDRPGQDINAQLSGFNVVRDTTLSDNPLVSTLSPAELKWHDMAARAFDDPSLQTVQMDSGDKDAFIAQFGSSIVDSVEVTDPDSGQSYTSFLLRDQELQNAVSDGSASWKTPSQYTFTNANGSQVVYSGADTIDEFLGGRNQSRILDPNFAGILNQDQLKTISGYGDGDAFGRYNKANISNADGVPIYLSKVTIDGVTRDNPYLANNQVFTRRDANGKFVFEGSDTEFFTSILQETTTERLADGVVNLSADREVVSSPGIVDVTASKDVTIPGETTIVPGRLELDFINGELPATDSGAGRGVKFGTPADSRNVRELALPFPVTGQPINISYYSQMLVEDPHGNGQAGGPIKDATINVIPFEPHYAQFDKAGRPRGPLVTDRYSPAQLKYVQDHPTEFLAVGDGERAFYYAKPAEWNGKSLLVTNRIGLDAGSRGGGIDTVYEKISALTSRF